MRLWLDGVHKIGELHGLLNEEDRYIVTDNIPISLLRVELDGEPSHIADSVLIDPSLSTQPCRRTMPEDAPHFRVILAPY